MFPVAKRQCRDGAGGSTGRNQGNGADGGTSNVPKPEMSSWYHKTQGCTLMWIKDCLAAEQHNRKHRFNNQILGFVDIVGTIATVKKFTSYVQYIVDDGTGSIKVTYHDYLHIPAERNLVRGYKLSSYISSHNWNEKGKNETNLHMQQLIAMLEQSIGDCAKGQIIQVQGTLSDFKYERQIIAHELIPRDKLYAKERASFCRGKQLIRQ